VWRVSPGAEPSELGDLRRRLDLLEEENQRLRAKLEPILGPDNPAFDTQRFNKALLRVNLMMLPVFLMIGIAAPAMIALRPYLPAGRVGPLPMFDVAGIGTRHPGVGIGVVAFGGFALGAVAVGGGALGILAVGGGAVGIVAIGGGAAGIIAYGGGAVGYIAVGNDATGYYALGQKGRGKYVLTLHRQDDAAIEFFCRWLPFLRAAVTRPMPVIPLPRPQQGQPP
jgi:hypothetical protein